MGQPSRTGRDGPPRGRLDPVLALALLALVPRLWGLGRAGLWADEMSTAQCVAGSWNGLWELLRGAPVSNPNANPPLYFVLLWFWTHVFGAGELSLRVPSALSGVLGVLLAGLCARRLGGRSAGGWAALLLALHPALVIYSREARPYALAFALLAGLLLLVLTAAEPERPPRLSDAAAFALLSSALAMTQYNLAPMPFAFAAWTWSRNRAAGRRFAEALLAPVALLVWWLPSLAGQLFSGAASYYTAGWRLVDGFGSLALAERVAFLFSGLAAAEFSVPFTTALVPAWAVAASAAGSLGLAWLHLRWVSRQGPLWIFFVYAALLFLLDALAPNLSSKHLLFALPFVLVSAAVALASHPSRTTLALAGAALAGWVCVDAAVAFKWRKSSEREAGFALAQLRRDGADGAIFLPGFVRDAVCAYAGASCAAPLDASAAPRRPLRLAVLDFFPRSTDEAPLRLLLREKALVPTGRLAWGASPGGGEWIVFEARDPKAGLAAARTALESARLPFDPVAVWSLGSGGSN